MATHFRPLRVSHLITNYSLGGAENHLRTLTDLQTESELECQIISLFGTARMPLDDKVSRHDLNGSYYSVFTYLRLFSLLLKYKPDIIHTHLPPAHISYWLIKPLLSLYKYNPAWVVSQHNDEPFVPQWLLHKFVGSLVLRSESKIIAISDSVKKHIVTNYKISPSKIQVVYYGISPYSMSERVEKNHDSINYGIAARLTPQKNLFMLLEAFSIFCSSNPHVNANLIVAGTGPLENELKVYASNLGIASKMRWLGFLSDIDIFYNQIDFFVLTSHYEGLGLVLLEAQARGIPVLSTAVSSIPFIVKENYSGFLDYSRTAESFSRILLKSISCTLKYSPQQIAHYISHKFSLADMVNDTIRIYRATCRE